jgi:hypothetical protein
MKFWIVFIFTIISFNLFSWDSYGEIKVSYIPEHYEMNSSMISPHPVEYLKSELFLGVTNDLFFLENKISTKTYMPKEIEYLGPFSVEYCISGGIKYESIKIGVEHFCTHPVKTYGEITPDIYCGSSSIYFSFVF